MTIPNIDLSQVTGLRKNSNTPPRISTRSHLIDGKRGSQIFDVLPGNQGILFEEHFDDQPEWTSTMHGDHGATETRRGDILPDNWDMLYTDTQWAPETGYPDNHASLEILDINSDKTRTGTGKSAVFWRESYRTRDLNWASDAQLIKVLEGYHNELYVEFWMRFSENWFQRHGTGSWQSKIFRVGSYSGTGPPYNGAGGEVGPRMFWGYWESSYGVRNKLSLYNGPHGGGGKTSTGLQGSLNFTNNTKGMGVDGTDPQIPDLVNGGFINNESNAFHEQVYGGPEVWTKMGFYLKLNSSPGAADGVLRQWINDVRFYNDESITWIPDTATEEQMLGWNYIAIGGNDWFQPYPNEDRFEDWWALDDLVVSDTIPSNLN